MKGKLITLLSLTTMLAITGCAKKGVSTANIKVSNAFAFSDAGLQGISAGGLFIWGKSSTGHAFGQLIDSDTVTVDLPNGNWTFYSVAWTGVDTALGLNGQPLMGKPRCSQTSQLELSGSPVNIDLVLKNSNCAGSQFQGGISSPITNTFSDGAGTVLPTIETKNCNNLSNINSLTDICHDDPTVAGFKSYRGYAGSYRLVLKSYTRLANGQPEFSGDDLISSKCIEANNFAGGVPTGEQLSGFEGGSFGGIPAGSGTNSPFLMAVRAYYNDDTCNESQGFSDIVLPNGLATNSARSKTFWNTTNVVLAIETTGAMICQGSRLTSDFAGGEGSMHAPYVICNSNQLLNVGEGGATTSSHYALAADIDMNPQTHGFAGQQHPRLYDETNDCWRIQPGNNFIPIAGTLSGCFDEAPTYTSGPFQGGFYGRSRAIKHIRSRLSSNDVGLFARLADGARISGLKLISSEFEGNFGVGSLAGISQPSSSTVKIADIVIEDGDVQAGNCSDNSNQCDIGGVVGKAVKTHFDRIVVKRTSITTNGSNAGGVVGSLGSASDTSRITQASAHIELNTHNPSGNSKIGGIVGYCSSNAGSPNIISEATTSGLIDLGGNSIGGIAGDTSYCYIRNSYSTISLLLNAPSSCDENGGIAGYLGNGEILNSGFFGTIRTKCASSMDIGKIVGDAGGSTVDGLLSYNSASGAISSIGTGSISNSTESTIAGITLPNAFNTSDLNSDSIADNLWVQGINGTVKDIPRLMWEKHPCALATNLASVNSQISAGRGSLLNPVSICSLAQLAQVGTSSSTHYNLETDLFIGNPGADNFVVGTSFGGHLHAKNFALHGANLYRNSTGAMGIFSGITSTATINELNLLGISLESFNTNNGYYAGILAPTSGGVLTRVFAYGTDVKGKINIGGLVGKNLTGAKIERTEIYGSVRGNNNVGGLVAKNEGTIRLAQANIELGVNNGESGTLEYFGGIASYNLGLIEKATSRVRFQHPSPASSCYSSTCAATVGKIGMLVSVNQSGAILRHSIVDEQSNISIDDISYSNDDVAGLIYENSGTAKFLISAGDTAGVDVVNFSSTIVNQYNLSNTEDLIEINPLAALESDISIDAPSCAQVGTSWEVVSDSFLGTTAVANGSHYLIDTLNKVAYEIVSVDEVTGTLGLQSSTDPCSSGLTSETEWEIVNKAATNKVRTLTSYAAKARAIYGTGWGMYAEDNPTERAIIFANYAAFMQNQNPPTIVPTWEIGRDGQFPRIFDVED